MHQYSIDTNERFLWISGMSLVAVGAAYILHVLQEWTGLFDWWWFDAPAALGLASLAFALFNRWAWKARVLHALGLVSTPDLSGEWSGTIKSSHDAHETERSVVVRITQTWTNISVTLETESSRSESRLTGITIKGDGAPEIVYAYTNQPKSGSAPTMNTHDGTACLRLSNSDTLEGGYYSGRGRLNEGSLVLRRGLK